MNKAENKIYESLKEANNILNEIIKSKETCDIKKLFLLQKKFTEEIDSATTGYIYGASAIKDKTKTIPNEIKRLRTSYDTIIEEFSRNCVCKRST